MNNDDLISRQAAIEYFMTNTNWHDEDGYPIDDAEEKRKLLEDYFNGISSVEPSCSEFPNRMNDDLISRQAAIEAIESIGSLDTDADREYARSVFGTLPSVQPEIEPKTGHWKTGHWIEDAKTYYEELKKRSLGVDEYTPYFTDDIACSECLAKYSVLDNETQFFKHCPNCGARMEGNEK